MDVITYPCCNLDTGITHCGPVWGHKSGSTLDQIMACCLTAPSHYLNQCDLPSVRSSCIHLSAILPEIPEPSVTVISLKITYLKFCSNLLGANELTHYSMVMPYGDTDLGLHKLAQAMACLMGPSHYHNQCWPIIS